MVAYQLPNAFVLEVSGRHARRYLNNRLSNDIAKLSIGANCRAAALSPQGKIEALFSVICESEERFLLTCDGGDREQIMASLLKYKVADQVSAKVLLDLKIVHITDAPSVEALNTIHPIKRLGVIGSDYIMDSAQFDAFANSTKFISEAEFKNLRLTQGRAQFPEELAGLLISEADSDEAISFTKGCYVGQEVNAKIDALGEAPRKLLRVKIDGEDALSEYDVFVDLDGRRRNIGEVLSVVANNGLSIGFAVLKNDAELLKKSLQVSNRKIILS